MRLSLVFELLLVFVLLAFAASKSVPEARGRGRPLLRQQSTTVVPVETKPTTTTTAAPVTSSPSNRYCQCTTTTCNCCREFRLAALRGPGCASLKYLKGDQLDVSLSFANRVITRAVVSDKKPRAVCMPLPGGFSRFCGRIYNIGRKQDHFGACLGLELRASADVEAAVRVSCFRFGPEGMKLEPPQPLPPLPDSEDDDDDDDDDDFEYDAPEYDDDDDDDDDDENAVDTDYAAFGLLGDDFLAELDEDDDDDEKPVVQPQPIVPIKRKPTRQNPPKKKPVTQPPRKKTTQKPARTTQKTTSKPKQNPTQQTTVSTTLETTVPSVVPEVVTVVSSTRRLEFDAVTVNSQEQTTSTEVIDESVRNDMSTIEDVSTESITSTTLTEQTTVDDTKTTITENLPGDNLVLISSSEMTARPEDEITTQ